LEVAVKYVLLYLALLPVLGMIGGRFIAVGRGPGPHDT
jgi:hypothetical protein